jgi:hypothetical protein
MPGTASHNPGHTPPDDGDAGVDDHSELSAGMGNGGAAVSVSPDAVTAARSGKRFAPTAFPPQYKQIPRPPFIGETHRGQLISLSPLYVSLTNTAM